MVAEVGERVNGEKGGSPRERVRVRGREGRKEKG